MTIFVGEQRYICSYLKKINMKKVNVLLFGLLIVGMTFLTACKKENKIKKNLWYNGGEWIIESVVEMKTSSNEANSFTITRYNYGTYTFKENGTGHMKIGPITELYEANYEYSNTKDKLSFTINGGTRVFDILEWKKDNLKMSITEKYTQNNEQITYIETYTLKKIPR